MNIDLERGKFYNIYYIILKIFWNLRKKYFASLKQESNKEKRMN